MSYESDILAAYLRKPENFDALLRVLHVCTEHPTLFSSEKVSKSGLTTSSYYRALKSLKNKGLLLEDCRPRRTFSLPDQITKGILPPVGWRATHLAAYLTKFRNDEIVHPYGMTVAEILEQVKEPFLINPLLGADVLYGLQNRLAILALVTGDLTGFRNMAGKNTPPDSLEELNQ